MDSPICVEISYEGPFIYNEKKGQVYSETIFSYENASTSGPVQYDLLQSNYEILIEELKLFSSPDIQEEKGDLVHDV